jgi:hypothetical protein
MARKFDTGAGEGSLWGVGFDPVTQGPVAGDGRIAGKEILAYNDDGSGTKNVAMFVQIPDNFEQGIRPGPGAGRQCSAIHQGEHNDHPCGPLFGRRRGHQGR